jgi:hypothetical protein
MGERMSNGFLRDEDSGALVTISAGAGSSNGRVLLWDVEADAYDHPEWWGDTSQPREFVGPQIANPANIAEIAGPVFGDRWTPTEAVA